MRDFFMWIGIGQDKVEILIIPEIIKYSWWNIYTLLLSNLKFTGLGWALSLCWDLDAGNCCMEEQAQIQESRRMVSSAQA